MILKSVKYPVRKNWLYFIISMGAMSLIMGLIGMIISGLDWVYAAQVIFGIVFIYQFSSFSQLGYVSINDAEIIINRGLVITKLVVTDISQIIILKNSCRLISKDGKRNSIGLNFIDQKFRIDLIEKICQIENRISMLHNIN